jgi:hypothetical protein
MQVSSSRFSAQLGLYYTWSHLVSCSRDASWLSRVQLRFANHMTGVSHMPASAPLFKAGMLQVRTCISCACSLHTRFQPTQTWQRARLRKRSVAFTVLMRIGGTGCSNLYRRCVFSQLTIVLSGTLRISAHSSVDRACSKHALVVLADAASCTGYKSTSCPSDMAFGMCKPVHRL